jgi:hypothetical protein
LLAQFGAAIEAVWREKESTQSSTHHGTHP